MAARVVGVAVAICLLVSPVAASASRTVYVTDGSATPRVAALSVGSGGALSTLPSSPFTAPAASAPNGVALSTDGRFLYTANTGGATVNGFAVSPDGGLSGLTGSPFATGQASGGQGVAVAPTNFLYKTQQSPPSTLAGLAIAADGSLSPVPASPIPSGGGNATGIVVVPGGPFLYVANRTDDNVGRFSIGADGALTSLGLPTAPGDDPRGGAVTPDGRFLYIISSGASDTVSAFSIAADGALTPVGAPVATSNGPSSAAITPDGRHLYVTSQFDNNVSAYRLGADGAPTPIGAFPAATTPRGVAASPDGRFLYVSNEGSDDISAYDIAADGTLSQVIGSPFASGVNISAQFSLAISPNQGPVAAFSVTPALPGAATAFDAGASSDSDGTVARFDWDFGDGQVLSDGGPTPTHVYGAPGTYTAKLTVTDGEGCSTQLVYTGQTASCNGTTAASAQQTFDVTSPVIPPVDDIAPVLGLFGKKKQNLDSAIEVGATCDEPCTVTGSGRLAVTTPSGQGGKQAHKRKSFKLKQATALLVAGERRTLKLKLSKKARRTATKALQDGGKVVAKVTVQAADAAGNSVSSKRQVKLRLK